MIKVWLALGFALVTALVTMIAGGIAEARWTVVLSRAGLAFIVAAVAAYGLQIVLMRYSTPETLNNDQTLSEDMVPDPDQSNINEEEAAQFVAAGSSEHEGSQEERMFSPLSPDGLRHVSSPQD